MRYPRIIAAIRSEVWMITPSTFQAIADVLSARLMGERQNDDTQPFSPMQPRIEPEPVGRIAVVPVWGIIGKRLDWFESMCGGCDLERVSAELTAGVNDTSVTDVILHFDTPGGVSTGVPELADQIRELDQVKPIYAFTDTLMASAGYWLASACRGVFATGSSQVGSIGAYIALINSSQMWAQEGMKLELMKSGQFKAMGISGKPFEDHERAFLQARVDKSFNGFVAAVRRNRDVPDSAMEGQTFDGEDAVAAGLVDEVVSDLGELVAQIEEARASEAA